MLVQKLLNGIPYTETRSFSEIETEQGTIIQKLKIKREFAKEN